MIRNIILRKNQITKMSENNTVDNFSIHGNAIKEVKIDTNNNTNYK
jgi:hypothetical protein